MMFDTELTDLVGSPLLDRRVFLAGAAGLAATALLPSVAGAAEATTGTAAVLDHITLGATNLYVSAAKLTEEIKIGNYDGGWYKQGFYTADGAGGALAAKQFPLGEGVFGEVLGAADPFNIAPGEEPWIVGKALHLRTEVLGGFTLRVATLPQLEAIARRIGGTVDRDPGLTRIRPNGPPVRAAMIRVSVGSERLRPSQLGLPEFCCWEDRLYCHPSSQPTVPIPGLLVPAGVAWLEVGGTHDRMESWLGFPPAQLRLRFNGMPPGLYAVGINTDRGEVILRRPPASQTT